MVSVVIPCHNHAQYLRRAVESVLSQTYRDFEIVIVDDGSTDNTSDIARELVAENPEVKIVFIEQEQQGAPRALNVGVRGSSGVYVLTLGADDTIEPRMLEETVAAIESDPKAGIVYTYTSHRSDPDSPPEGGAFEDSVQEYPDFDFGYWVRNNPQLDACSLVRREAFDQAGGFDPGQFAEDLDLWLGIAKRGWIAKLVPKPLFNYWHHGGSRESHESWTRPVDLRWQLIHKHPELYDPGERLYVGSLMLGSVAAGSAELATTIADSATNGLDWITVSSQARRVDADFSELLAECESVAEAKVSDGLHSAIHDLLATSRQTAAALSVLASACEARKLDDADDAAEQLRAMLPRIGDEMVRVFKSGLREVYGPTAQGGDLSH